MFTKKSIKKASFIGIGSQKCASTWFYKIISDHPEISISDPKELDYFSNYFDKGIDWYESFFDVEKVYGDISPSYFIKSQVPKRIFEYNKDMKIVVSLREPVSRLCSQYLHQIRIGKIKKTITALEAAEADSTYYEYSLYGKHLSRWLEIFPKEQIYIFFQEDLSQHSEKIANEVYEFLGVDCSHRSSFTHFKANQSKQHKMGIGNSLIRNVAKILKIFIGNNNYLKLKTLPVFTRLINVTKTDVASKALPFTDLEKEAFKNYFSEDLKILHGIVGDDSFPYNNSIT